jgi:hypothetical protein
LTKVVATFLVGIPDPISSSLSISLAEAIVTGKSYYLRHTCQSQRLYIHLMLSSEILLNEPVIPCASFNFLNYNSLYFLCFLQYCSCRPRNSGEAPLYTQGDFNDESGSRL